MGAASLRWKVRENFSNRELLEPFIYTQRVIVYSCEGSAGTWEKNQWK